MTNPEKLRGMLGLAQRAGRLQTGADMTIAAIRSGKAKAALVDGDACKNTVKKINDACIYYRVRLLKLPGGLLEAACGRDGRMMGAVTDTGFAEKIITLMTEDAAQATESALK